MIYIIHIFLLSYHITVNGFHLFNFLLSSLKLEKTKSYEILLIFSPTHSSPEFLLLFGKNALLMQLFFDSREPWPSPWASDSKESAVMEDLGLIPGQVYPGEGHWQPLQNY